MSWIVQEIDSRGGALTFHDFMELALYHPDHGYYRSDSARYGRHGDFLTAPSASRWYGEVVALLLAGLSTRLGPVTMIDVGSGDGSFVRRVVMALGRSAGQVLGGVVSVESSAEMRLQQRARLESLSVPVECIEQIPDVSDGGGAVVVHASELHDALPVHRVVAREDGLRELWVTIENGVVCWLERTAPSVLEEYFTEHGVTLEDGQLAEVNLDARALHHDLLRSAGDSGLALTLDYGYPASRLYDPRGRFGGSIACYREHRLGRDPLRHPGRQDITAHVNWDDLRSVAHDIGWVQVGLWPLAEFLVRSGIGGVMEGAGIGPDADANADVVAERQEVKRLLDPDGMGADLKVLVQTTEGVFWTVQELLQIEK